MLNRQLFCLPKAFLSHEGEKIEAWFVYPTSREYFVLNPQLFCLPTNSQKIYPLVRSTAKYVFSISEAIKIVVSFRKFLYLYDMLPLRNKSKYDFIVA